MPELVALHAEEEHPEADGGDEPPDEPAAIVMLEGMVRQGHGDAAREQDQGVDCRETPGRDDLEGAADVLGAVGGPDCVEAGPQERARRGAPDTLAPEPGDGEDAGVEQRAEEGGEEHDLGEDEPAHAPAERDVHLVVVGAGLALPHHGAEPTEEHVQHHHGAGDHGPLPDGVLVEDHGETAEQQEQPDGAGDGPAAGFREIIGVLGSGHSDYLGLCCLGSSSARLIRSGPRR